jgi:hypothetical protein
MAGTYTVPMSLSRGSNLICGGMLMLALVGCGASVPRVSMHQWRDQPLDDRTARRVDALEAELTAMLGRRSPEARLIAFTAVVYPLALRERYGVTMPHWFHNTAVAARVADRGLCCHWARDLLDELETLNLYDFELQWGVAFHQLPFEHSSVVVTARGQPFDTGIILDGWRHAGVLYWARTTRDTWPWRPHPLSRPGVRIDCSG